MTSPVHWHRYTSFQLANNNMWVAASVLPLLAAKQRVTHANDWMTSDALIACPDPNCRSVLRITRTGKRTFSHGETTVVGLEGNA